MLDPVAVWNSEHKRFARLLDMLERQMAAFHNDEHPDYELMRDIVQYLHDFGDRFHHPREDVAFARLIAHDPGLALAVNRLLQEHRVIDLAGQKLIDYLDDILNDVLLERQSVEAAAATYLVYYRHHLTTEKNEILPRASELLKDEDWAAVASAVATVSDPLLGSHVSARYRSLREQIADVA
jgi:hemerythrin-like domain-containing protein